ncbi:MAG: nitroreductase family protein [Myxococcota bacterium]
MDLYEAMRTTPATREFTGDPLPQETLVRVLDHARFASSGRNAQPWRVIVVRDAQAKQAIGDLAQGPFKEYVAQLGSGSEPFSASDDGVWRPPAVDLDAARKRDDLPRFEAIDQCAALLVVCADLSKIAFLDGFLERQSLIGGASIYPFVQNLLLGLRSEGFGGVPITFTCREEPALRERLGIPQPWAVACTLAAGKPARTITRLKRKPVSAFACDERFDGPPLEN